jgi:hypothetical protein
MSGHMKKFLNSSVWLPFIDQSDFVDIKAFEGCVSLRQFIASMLSYYPPWLLFLYRLRKHLAAILGLAHHPEPEKLPNLHPPDVSFTAGTNVTFFKVRRAKEDKYWISETPQDKHLKAYFGVATEPTSDSINRFYVVTTVYYKHWTGPVYFNFIRPFHHFVVFQMARAGLKRGHDQERKTDLNVSL